MPASVRRRVGTTPRAEQPDREAAWIAEHDGKHAGCVVCVAKDDRTAQLRVLLVDPSARGLGLGRRLVEVCVDFARTAGYSRLVLGPMTPSSRPCAST